MKKQRQKRLKGFNLVELMVVLGVLSLIIGAMLAFLVIGVSSTDINEAQLLAREYAQQAMGQISRELQLTSPFHLRIANNLGWGAETSPGSAVNFQLPVGIYGALNLTDDQRLRWGSEDAESHFISYSLNNFQLLRSTYAATDGSGAVSRVITTGISALTFSRPDTASDLVHITLTAQVQGRYGLVNHTVASDVRLRN